MIGLSQNWIIRIKVQITTDAMMKGSPLFCVFFTSFLSVLKLSFTARLIVVIVGISLEIFVMTASYKGKIAITTDEIPSGTKGITKWSKTLYPQKSR
jgi:hypothetical protein